MSRRSLVIRFIWLVAVVALIAMLLAADSSGLRLRLLTALSWLAFPSSFLAAPVVNQLLVAFDVENTGIIDLTVSMWISVIGYIQWFWLVPLLLRASR